MNFVAIDVETAIGKRWSIYQIGLAIVENGEITQTFSRLVPSERILSLPVLPQDLLKWRKLSN